MLQLVLLFLGHLRAEEESVVLLGLLHLASAWRLGTIVLPHLADLHGSPTDVENVLELIAFGFGLGAVFVAEPWQARRVISKQQLLNLLL